MSSTPIPDEDVQHDSDSEEPWGEGGERDAEDGTDGSARLTETKKPC